MAEDFTWNDRYAGDAAWTEWFEICSVGGCSPENAARLRPQVESAMYAQLSRAGFTRDDVGDEDPVAFFDAYFKLKGARDTKKPLKSYFAYRIKVEGIKLVNFVCGTLFGSGSGRIRDIVTDWISACKGWKPRTVTSADGSRHLAWENAGGENLAAVEQADFNDPAAFLDEAPIRQEICRVLQKIADKIKVEKSKVALLLYATAMDVSITEPVVLEGLGSGKSRAYAIRDKAMQELEREMNRIEGADDPLFGRLLRETCEKGLADDMRAKLGGVM